MKVSRNLRRALAAIAAGLVLSAGDGAQSAAKALPPTPSVECLGYFTIALPGDFEYAMNGQFSGGLGTWGSEIRLDLIGLQEHELSISPSAGAAELKALMEASNKDQQREKDRLLETAKWLDENPDVAKDIDPEGRERKSQRELGSRVPFYQLVPDRDAIFFPGKEELALAALVNGHILSTEVKPQGTPEQTLDAFLGHYKPRALGEVPTGPGVCVPYGFFTGERQPATVGLNIRLKDQPDVVIFLLATDAASDPPDDPHKLLNGLEPVATFFGSRRVTPLHAIKPLRSIMIDGHEGLGSFVRITRRTVADQRTAFNNAAENDEDWGYFAYVPGLSGHKPGDSFNMKFKVERFGRFAKHPMSEDEFRELVMRIASSIKRRPGAWVPN